MKLGNIAKKAASAFGKSKTGGPKGPEGARRTGSHGGSPEEKLARNAAKVVKKKF